MKLFFYYHCLVQAAIALISISSVNADDTTSATFPSPVASPVPAPVAQPDPLLAARTAPNCANDSNLPGKVVELPVFYYTSITPDPDGWQATADDFTWKAMMVGSTYHALLKFNVEDFPKDTQVQVICAEVDYEQTNSPTPLELHRITIPWTTKANWEYSNNPATSWSRPGGDYDIDSLSTFDDGVTALSTIPFVNSVQNILDGAVENNGFLVRAKRTGDIAVELTNPRLYIRYASTWTAPFNIAYTPGANTKPPTPDPVPFVRPVPKPTKAPIPRPNPSPLYFPGTSTSTWDDDTKMIDSGGDVPIIAIAASGGVILVGLIVMIIYFVDKRGKQRAKQDEDAAKVMPSQQEVSDSTSNNLDTDNDESFSDALAEKPIV